WVERRLASGDYGCAAQIEQLLPRGAVGESALHAYIDALGSPGRQALLADAIQRFGPALRATTRGWGKAGCAWAGVHDYARAVEWMADWPQRSDAEPWMLINLAIALRSLQRDADARQVHERALSLPDSDYTSPFHR